MTMTRRQMLGRSLAALGGLVSVPRAARGATAEVTFQLGWIADLPDPDAFLRTLFEPGGTANYFNFLDDETAAALERGASETNPIERARIYRELERSILEKAPLIPLFHSTGMIAARRDVRGLKPGPMGIASLDLETVWLAGQGKR